MIAVIEVLTGRQRSHVYKPLQVTFSAGKSSVTFIDMLLTMFMWLAGQ